MTVTDDAATPEGIGDPILDLLNEKPDKSKPFLFNDSDRWLEKDLEKLAQDLLCQGELVDKTSPILESFDQFFEAQE